jgi:hypothetical protein
VVENQGLFAALEAQGRKGDTEIGRIDRGSLVIPVAIAEAPEFVEIRKALGELFNAARFNINSFTVTPENTSYSVDEENVVDAHLTNGELVIPAVLFQLSAELRPAFEQLFNELGININQYTVGHQDNAINPQTGLPEFGLLSSIKKFAKKVVDTVVDTVKSAASFVGDAFSSLGDVLGDIGGSIVDIAASPLGQLVLQVIPVTAPYAKYISAAAKVINGDGLSASDFVSLGISGLSDINADFTVPDAVKDAATVAARISDGGDPIQALIGTYGADFMEVTGLGETLKTGVSDILGEEGFDFVEQYMDPDQAVTDLIAGESPLRMLSNQFGDELVNYMADDDPNLQALGYGGIRTAIGLDEGLDLDQAFLRGAEEYYKRGGELPDINKLGEITGLDGDFTTPEWLSKFWNNIPDFELPEGINWKNLGMSIPDIQLDFEGIDLGSLDWEGLDYDVLQDYSLPELRDMNVDLSGLNLPELSLSLGLANQQMQGTRRPWNPDEEEEDMLKKRTTDNELLAETTPLSEALLQRTFTL